MLRPNPQPSNLDSLLGISAASAFVILFAGNSFTSHATHFFNSSARNIPCASKSCNPCSTLPPSTSDTFHPCSYSTGSIPVCTGSAALPKSDRTLHSISLSTKLQWSVRRFHRSFCALRPASSRSLDRERAKYESPCPSVAPPPPPLPAVPCWHYHRRL